ncbi:hypothetical protein ACEPPN_011873 [Leptodophora sp. 'Broadleaf-Isolate-01']
MDTVPGNINIPTLVDRVTSGRFLSVVALPQLNLGMGKETDALKIRMIGDRINESLDQGECRKKAPGSSFPLDEKSPEVGEAEGSKTGELRGLQSFTGPKSVNSVGHHDALERAPASKTSPSSQERSRSRPHKSSPPPLNFSMRASSGGQFEASRSIVRNVKRRRPILTLSKSGVPNQAQPGSDKDNSGEGGMHSSTAEFRASFAPLSVKDTARTSEEQDKFSNDKDAEGNQSSTGPANPPHQESCFVNFKRMDGRYRVEGMSLIDPTELSSTDGSYQMLGRFVPMRIQYVLFEDSQSLPQSSTNPPTTEPGPLLAAEEIKSMIRAESLHCPFNITPESVSKSSKFRTLALSLCNLWIVFTSLWALYSAWQHSDEMLAGLGARVEDLKEIGLWVLDMLFGFIGSVV